MRVFKARTPDKTLEEIRKATSKEWALGNSYFRDKVEGSNGTTGIALRNRWRQEARALPTQHYQSSPTSLKECHRLVIPAIPCAPHSTA